MILAITATMNSPTVSESSISSQSSIDSIILHRNTPSTMEDSGQERLNMIEPDSNVEGVSTMELTPYPYNPTSEEIKDFHHLEVSLGEDWSYRLACELSSADMSLDGDGESLDDSVSFYDNNIGDSEGSQLLPEDIEICTYPQRDTFFDNIESYDVYSL
jgi:hypothetical protein